MIKIKILETIFNFYRRESDYDDDVDDHNDKIKMTRYKNYHT